MAMQNASIYYMFVDVLRGWGEPAALNLNNLTCIPFKVFYAIEAGGKQNTLCGNTFLKQDTGG
jgi:hypothetical protein